jgi:hypothetical protein
MAQFDVYPNPIAERRTFEPFVIEVQSNLNLGLNTTVVVPMLRTSAAEVAERRLHPELHVGRLSVLLSTPELYAVPRSALAAAVSNLQSERVTILSALDRFFTGF